MIDIFICQYVQIQPIYFYISKNKLERGSESDFFSLELLRAFNIHSDYPRG